MDTVPPPPPTDATVQPVAEDKTPAILAYVTLIGFVVAIILHSQKKTRIGAYHLRQALGIFITWFVGAIVCGIIPIIGWFIMMPLWILSMIILLVLGLVAAANGQMKPVPVLGAHYQKWFGTAFE